MNLVCNACVNTLTLQVLLLWPDTEGCQREDHEC
jgi:hypothetical protein